MSAFYIFLKTFPCWTAECERGFSVMNNICTDLRSRLTINNISNLMFININRPPLSDLNPEYYVKSWLFNYRCAEDPRTKIARNNRQKRELSCQKIHGKFCKLFCFKFWYNVKYNISIIFYLLICYSFKKKMLFLLYSIIYKNIMYRDNLVS